MRDLIGFYRRKKLCALRELLLHTKDELEREVAAGRALAPEQAPAACERCGSTEAAYLDLGVFVCVGLWPIAYFHSWRPTPRLLCFRHAVRDCLLLNLVTSLLGYLGIPGSIAAPVRVWRNLSSLKNAYPISEWTVGIGVVLGILAPLVAAAYIAYRIV